MANQLKLQVLLAAVDKITRPLKSIQGAAGSAARDVSDTQKHIKELNKAAGQIDGYRKVSKSLGLTSNELGKAQTEAQRLAKELAATANPTKGMICNFEQARSQVQRLERRQAELIQTQRNHRAMLKDAGIDTRSLATHQRDLTRQLGEANRALEQQKTKLAEVSAQQKKLAAARQKYDKALEARGPLAAAGGTAAAAGAAGLGVFAGQAVSADMAGAKIAAQLGQQDAGGEYTNVINTVYRTGISGSLEDAANAVSVVTAAFGSLENISAAQLASLTGHAETLARAFDIDVKEATQAAAIMVKNGLAANADEAFDLMTRGMQNVSAAMREELPEILHEYSTNFRGLGFTGKEAMNLLAAQAEQGKFALDKTGDALKEFTLRGSDMSKTSIEAYEAIGLNAAKMSSAVASGGESARQALQQTARGLLAIEDPADRANTAIALFGTPIEDLSVDQIPQFLQALGHIPDQVGQVNGATGKLADTLTNNAGDALRQIQRLISGEMMAVLQDFQGDIIGISKAVTSWAKENPALVSGLAKAAVTVGVLAIAGGTLALTIAGLLGPFAAMRYAAQVLGIKALPSLLPMLKAVGAGFIKLGIAIMTTPVGWILAAVAAIAGAGYLIYKNWDTVKQWLVSFWQGFKNLCAGGWELVKTLFSWSPLGLVINNWGQITSWLGQFWEATKTLASAGTQAIKDIFFSFHPLGLLIANWSAVTGWFGTLPDKFREYGADILSGLINGITAQLSAVKDKVVGAGKAVAGWFKETLGIRSPSRVFTQFGDDTMQGLANGLAGNNSPEQQVTATAKRLKAAGAGITLGMTAMPAVAELPLVSDTQRNITEQLQPVALSPVTNAQRQITEQLQPAALSPVTNTQRQITEQLQPAALSPVTDAQRQITEQLQPAALSAVTDAQRQITEQLQPASGLTNADHDYRQIIERLQPAGLPPIPDETRTIRERVERADMPDTSAAVARIQTQQQEQTQSWSTPTAPAVQDFSIGKVEINITAEQGMNPQDIAAQVRRELEAFQRQQAARNRARLSDME